MFTQSICLTHYSKDFVEKLIMLGYVEHNGYSFTNSELENSEHFCVCTGIYDSPYFVIVNKDIALSKNPRISWVNECTNRYITDDEDLAFALSTLKDDDCDKCRFFTIDCDFQFGLDDILYKKGELVFCERSTWNLDFYNDGIPCEFSNRNIPAHKATKEEIIEYFKNILII